MDKTIIQIVDSFTEALTSLIEESATERARSAVEAAFGMPTKRGPGRPPGKARKKPPRQLCPVPGCKNTAAPIFGMVCKGHKGVAKSLIKKYRKARSEAKKVT